MSMSSDSKQGVFPSGASSSSASTAGVAGLGAGGAAASQQQQQQAVQAVIKNVDMTEEMQKSVIEIAGAALAQFSVEKDVAAHVKRTLDTQFGPTWHAVVGKNYGSYVTHERKHFIYFYLGPMAFLLWRA
ncbi:Dynein light chain [Tilletia horrida]|uniref:Dynein light chain n=1 Tax=Tilletia horrida TaxID=155126 RepID=A0AAN6JIV7_9BASI|nr:Dynein light chain [Tilletia horrida]KAK0535126.1 Dynein light chain [Tilletia horrida]KAK0538053.1 Dynein light chain [Tilletia horrida]